ncbi:MAG TPA: DNA polymerase Y family protein [Bryobacteraceae bacterium]|nr:DNA polymerase Y family protein [Bryobacteraceae bacterium]
MESGVDYAVVDLRGLGRLIGTPRDIAMRMSAAMQTAGMDGSVAVASNPHAALIAARGNRGTTVIAAGDEARALAGLPLTLLGPEEELAATLESWGIRTFGDLSRLPAVGLAERLGSEGVRLHSLARGMAAGPLHKVEYALVFEASMELDHGVESLESLAFLLGRLTNQVCGELVRNGLAAVSLTLRLALDDRTEHVRTIRLPFASVDTAMFLKLLQLDLAAHPPMAEITGIYLRADPAEQRRLQTGLFIPAAPESEKLELTLARLNALVGEGNAGSPEVLNTHRPDAFTLKRFVARTDAPVRKRTAATTPPLAIRIYRPPIPARIYLREQVPVSVQAQGIRGDVVSFAGPWRTSGDWWKADPWMRDEWDLALDSGALYRVFREPHDRWFVGGNYD